MRRCRRPPAPPRSPSDPRECFLGGGLVRRPGVWRDSVRWVRLLTFKVQVGKGHFAQGHSGCEVDVGRFRREKGDR